MKLIFRSIAVGNKYPLFLQIDWNRTAPNKVRTGKTIVAHTMPVCTCTVSSWFSETIFECRCEP